MLEAPQVYRMYIVWGRSWPLVILPCACIAVYMAFTTVRYRQRLCRVPRSKHAAKAPQVLLQMSVQISRALSEPSHFNETFPKAETYKTDIIISFSLSLAANFFCTGEFIHLDNAVTLMSHRSDDHCQNLVEQPRGEESWSAQLHATGHPPPSRERGNLLRVSRYHARDNLVK
jgi:hypothetical protein